MSLNTWMNLACSCGSVKFVQLVNIRWSPGGGAPALPCGWRCADCHQEVDQGKLIQEQQIKVKKKELEQLQEEVGDPHAHTERPLPR